MALKGSIVALVTPFKENGDVDFDNYKYPLGKRKLLRYIVIGMVAGLLIKIHLLFIIPLALFAITIPFASVLPY